MRKRYTDSMLRDAVECSVFIAEVLRRSGLVEAGGNHTHISRRAKSLELDTSHFTGQAWRRGLASQQRKTPAELLVLRTPGSPRINGGRLRRAMLGPGLPYVCASCANQGSWRTAEQRT